MLVFFFKQKTAYEMRIIDWSSDVCSSDLLAEALADFNQATKLEPDDADVYFARGDVHYDMAEHALAIADYSAGLKLEGDAPWALWSRGLAHAQLGDSRAAHQDLDRALALMDGAEREEMLASTCRQLIGQRSEEHTSELQSLMST